jgi:NADH-quinone oxidoreductase subunit N
VSLQDSFSLLPLLILSATIVVTLLVIAFWRNHLPAFWLSLVGLVLALIALPFVSHRLPRHITSLFILDKFGIFYLGLILAGGLVTVLLSFSYMEKVDGYKGEYYLLILLATLGSAVLAISSHFVSFFLGTGIMSLSLYTLIAYTPLQRQRIEAAIKYLILVGAASAILLFGMALIYAAIGSMEFEQILLPSRLPLIDNTLLLIGLGLLIAGISFELALVPFHMWTPDVYQGAPVPVTGFIATVTKAGIFALMVRLFSHVSMNIGSPLWNEFALIAIASMLVGNLLAITQKNVKRILAYSSIAHMGYLMVPFLAGAALSSSAMAFYWVVYFITTLVAFGIITLFSDPVSEFDDLEDYRGLFRNHPWPAVMFSLALLSLTGLPPTGGLVGKVYLAAAGVQASLWVLLGALVIGSIIGVFYYMRIIMILFRQPKDESITVRPIDRGAALVLIGLSGALVVLGVYPTPLISLISHLVAIPG